VTHANIAELGFQPIEAFEAMPGHGIRAEIGGRRVLVGSERLMAEEGVAVPAAADRESRAARDEAILVHVAIDGRAAGSFVIADPIRVEAAEAMRDLARQGIEIWIVSGDRQEAATSVGARLGIPAERARGGMLPSDKEAFVTELQARGRRVAMVGDGINDAPALARADLGVAIGTGTDVALEASDVTLVGADLRAVLAAFVLSRRTTSVIRQNLFWAFGYNVLLIPVAMGALVPFFDVTLSPAMAAGAMALSSVMVVTNSLRLRGLDVRPGSAGASDLRPRGVRRLREVGYPIAVAALALLAASGAIVGQRALDAGAHHVEISAHELAFSLPSIEVDSGQLVVLRFSNDGRVFHDWQVDGLANVDATARPGETQEIRFFAPGPGRYTYRCTVDGHAEGGMTGTLVVRSVAS
jgi:Cu+-exporting ATPase